MDLRRLVGAGLLVLTVAACAQLPGDGADGTDGASETTAAPDTTEAPDTTQAPDTTEAPDTTGTPETTVAPDTGDPEDGGLSPSTIWIVLGLVVAFIFFGWLMGRGRKPSPPTTATAPATPGWRDHLREGYGQARWLADSLTEELAIWRGNHLADRAADQAGTELADRWAQLERRTNSARDSLYRAEASAPDPTSSQQIREAVDALNGARAAVDARAEARLQAVSNPSDAGAAERERIASTNLAETRVRFNDALTSLSGLI